LADEDGDFTVIERREIDASVLKVRIAGVSGESRNRTWTCGWWSSPDGEEACLETCTDAEGGRCGPPPVAPQAETGRSYLWIFIVAGGGCFSACSGGGRGAWRDPMEASAGGKKKPADNAQDSTLSKHEECVLSLGDVVSLSCQRASR